MATATLMARSKEHPSKVRQVRVTELDWHTFMKRHAHSHLLMGEYDSDEKPIGAKRSRLMLLKGLARALCRRGNYAVTMIRDGEVGDLAMVGVEHREDADRISRVFRARVNARVGPWCSQRSFTVDAASYRRIAMALLMAQRPQRTFSRPLLDQGRIE
jgi:hypothetical protein